MFTGEDLRMDVVVPSSNGLWLCPGLISNIAATTTLTVDSLTKSQRSMHIHSCCRQRVTANLNTILLSLFYLDSWRCLERSLPTASKYAEFQKHLKDHPDSVIWPMTCPHPLCYEQYEDKYSFVNHLLDEHDLGNYSSNTSISNGSHQQWRTGSFQALPRANPWQRPAWPGPCLPVTSWNTWKTPWSLVPMESNY